jgi:hypothetical protein
MSKRSQFSLSEQAEGTTSPERLKAVASVPTAERMALVIAVGEYKHLTKLPNAVEDGKALKQLAGGELDAGMGGAPG